MNKIGWCEKTVNYVRGCLTGCSYCYARRFNQRTWKKMFDIETTYRIENNIESSLYLIRKLGEDMRNFKPVFMYSQFAKPLPKKPMRIFMDSMSDIAYWQPEWVEKVLNKIKEYPQHQFLFLTKNDRIYKNYIFSKNCWLGLTIINQNDLIKKYEWYLASTDLNYRFLSIEPITNEINLKMLINNFCYTIGTRFNWIILGADSTRGKNKIIPKLEWIENIVNYCIENKIPIFIKDNLKPIINDLIQEFPKIKTLIFIIHKELK